MLDYLPHQGRMFNLHWDREIPKVDKKIKENEIITFGTQELKVIYTPGHSPCSITLVGTNEAFVGDLIFYDSVGRTDFHRGSHDELLDSIHNKIFTLQPTISLFCGHGPATTVQRERQGNPYI